MNKYMLILHNRHKGVVEIPFAMDFNAPYVMCFDDMNMAEHARRLLNDLIKGGCDEKVAWDLVSDVTTVECFNRVM